MRRRRLVLFILMGVVLAAGAAALWRTTLPTHGIEMSITRAPPDAVAELTLDPRQVEAEAPLLAQAFSDASTNGFANLYDDDVHAACAYLTTLKSRCFGVVSIEGEIFDVAVVAFG